MTLKAVVLVGVLATALAVPSKLPEAAADDKLTIPEKPEPSTALSGEKDEEGTKFPYRDLPADVLRDFPGLCFGSTALRLFHIGQSWSLAPFCGVATCLITEDGEQLVERVQDCGPQPIKNSKCHSINNSTAMEAAFPDCCPQYECEDGVELEYPTPEELLKMAQEAAEAVVNGQYVEEPEVQRRARQTEVEEEASVEEEGNKEDVEEEV